MRAEEGENQRQPGETAMTKNIDELNAMNDVSRFPMTDSQRNYYIRKEILEKKIKKK